MARRVADEGKCLFRRGRHQRVRCRGSAGQFIGGVAGTRRHRRRSQLFQAFKAGSETATILVELVRRRVAGESGWATVVAHKLTGPKGEFVGAVTRTILPETFEKYFASVA